VVIGQIKLTGRIGFGGSGLMAVYNDWTGARIDQRKRLSIIFNNLNSCPSEIGLFLEYNKYWP
jgi:hypothetical protein